jgi:hypothetical protein
MMCGGIMFICNFMRVDQIDLILTNSYCQCESVNTASSLQTVLSNLLT